MQPGQAMMYPQQAKRHLPMLPQAPINVPVKTPSTDATLSAYRRSRHAGKHGAAWADQDVDPTSQNHLPILPQTPIQMPIKTPSVEATLFATGGAGMQGGMMQQAMMGGMYPQQAMGHLPMLPQSGMPVGFNPMMQQQGYGTMPAQGDAPNTCNACFLSGEALAIGCSSCHS